MNNLSDVITYLENAGIMFLSSFDGERPHVRPIGFIMEHDNCLYPSTGINGSIYNDLHVNSFLELAAVHPSLPMNRIRVSGKADFNVSQSTLNKYYELNPSMKDVPGICLFELSNWTAIFYNGTSEKKEIKAS